jgi:transposase
MTRLEEVDADDLRTVLDDVGDLPTQRLMAAILYKEGFSVPTIAEWFEMREGTVYNWFDRIESQPIDQAIVDSPRGRNSRLSYEQQQVRRTIQQPPQEVGYDEPEWYPQLVQHYLVEAFDVEYSIGHIRKLMYEADISWTARPGANPGDDE